MAKLIVAGDAAVGNVLASKKFCAGVLYNETGTMTNNAGDVAAVSSHRDGTSIHVVPAAGYTDGSDDASVITDADFTAGNIKSGVDIFGLEGSYTGAVLTGDASVGDVLSGKTFYKDDAASKLTGTMTNKVGSATVITPSTSDQTIPQGYYGGAAGDGKVLGDADLVASNIKDTVVIFGVTGTYTGGASSLITFAMATVGDVQDPVSLDMTLPPTLAVTGVVV